MGTRKFNYDTLNRLATANVTWPDGMQQIACWSYDAFGNRTMESLSSVACNANPTPTTWAQYNGTVNGTNNNQMSQTNQNTNQGNGYDPAGNVTFDGVNTYTYDAEGRICAVKSEPMPGMTAMTGYLYDADGTRVAKGTITSMSCDPTANGFQFTENYVLGLGGEELTMLDGNNNWQRTNVYAGGKLLATYDLVLNGQGQQIPALHFHLEDPLGTRRMQLAGEIANLGQPETDIQSLPFGDQLNSYPDQYAPATADDSTPLHFTGKERDAESGNDYFGARYYASSMGRFMSPDWSAKVEPIPYSKLDDPQSLNLYAYVRNNPLTRFDPDGHTCAANDGLCQALNKAWNTLHQIATTVKDSFYLKVEVGTGIKAQVKGGPVKIEVGGKSVRETNAKSNNKGTVKNVDEASLQIKAGPVSIGPSISREQTIQTGDGPTNMDAPTTPWHGNLLYDLGKHTTGSNWEMGAGVGLFVGFGGSVEAGFDMKELYQGVKGAFSSQESDPRPVANQP
jgi:RHS repeat-associated protein